MQLMVNGFLSLFLALSLASPMAAQTVVINEIMPNPGSEYDGAEFIELYNPTGSSVNISDWVIAGTEFDGTCGGEDLWAFPPGSSIPAMSYVVIAKDNMLKKLVGLALFQTSVYLLYISPGKILGGTPPILDEKFSIYSNPLPHVLILTAIVVGVATLALGLALVVRINEAFGTIEEDDVVEMLEEMMVGLEALNRTAAWAKENEVQDWEEAAIWYLGEYESAWKTWVTDDAYDDIKAALAAG